MTKEEIEKNLIFLFLRGSHAYATNTPESDEDFGGVCMPSKKAIYGIEPFEQDDKWVDEKGKKVDKVIYNVVKTIDLMAQNNPNMLDFLYAPERVIKLTTPTWQRIVDIRDSFLCSKAKWSFQGYALAQLKRIQTHRGYLLNPPKSKPNRVDYGLPSKSVFPETQYEVIARISTDYVDEDRRNDFYFEVAQLIDREAVLIFKKYIPEQLYMYALEDFKKRQHQFLHAMSSISGKFLKEEFVHNAQNELRFLASRENWKRYQKWLKNRNPERAKLEAKCGYDSKHAMHLIRLLLNAVEIMSGKGVLVDRSTAPAITVNDIVIDLNYLMEVRSGNVPFETIIEISDALNK